MPASTTETTTSATWKTGRSATKFPINRARRRWDADAEAAAVAAPAAAGQRPEGRKQKKGKNIEMSNHIDDTDAMSYDTHALRLKKWSNKKCAQEQRLDRKKKTVSHRRSEMHFNAFMR